MQLNAPRLRSPCVSSKSTSSDDPAPHASRSKFRPSNGSRHSSRQRQNVDIAAVVGAVAGVVAGVDAKAFGGGVGGGEGGLRDAVSTGAQKASTRLISASSAASNSELISSSSSSSFVTCKMMREAIRVQSEYNQSAIRVQSECNQSAIRVPSESHQSAIRGRALELEFRHLLRLAERAALSAARLFAPLAVSSARVVQNGDDDHGGERSSRLLHVERHLMREAIRRPQRSSEVFERLIRRRRTSLPLSTCWMTAID